MRRPQKNLSLYSIPSLCLPYLRKSRKRKIYICSLFRFRPRGAGMVRMHSLGSWSIHVMSELGLRHWLVLLLCEPENSNNSCQPLTSDIFMVFCLEILRPNPKKNMVYGTLYAGVDYNLTLCPLYRVDSNTFIMGNPVPESTLSQCQSRLYPPVRVFGFGLCNCHRASNCQCQSRNSPEACTMFSPSVWLSY